MPQLRWITYAYLQANKLEALRSDRFGQYSIRINDQYRICFVWREATRLKWRSSITIEELL